MTVSAGETVIFNFDFTAAGAPPAPPYADIVFNSGVDSSSVDFTELGQWSLWKELDGGGTVVSSSAPP